MIFFKFFPTLFEPIAILMFLGLAGCFFLRKKNIPVKFFYYWFALIIIMIIWRVGIQAESSRYWAILIIPGILFCSVFCFFDFWPKRFSIILVCSIAVAALGKTIHFNYNSKMIINAANAIIAYQIPKQSSIIIEGGNSVGERLSYYSEVPAIIQDSGSNAVRQTILSLRGLYDTCFLVFSNTVNQESLYDPIIKEFNAELIYEQFHDNRQKRKLFVYKIIVPPPPEQRTDMIPFFVNGDFEEVVFKSNKKIEFPRLWDFVIAGNSTGECIPIYNDVISGKTSVKITNSGLPLTLYPETRNKVEEDGFIVFCIKQGKGTRLALREAVYKNNLEFISIRENELISILINTDDLHQFQIPVYKNNYRPEEVIRFYWIIQSPDGIIIDDIGFCPVLSTEQNAEQ